MHRKLSTSLISRPRLVSGLEDSASSSIDSRRSSLLRRLIQVSHTVQFSSVTQLCPTLFNPMDCSMPGFPVLHKRPAQTHVHRVSDAIQPSHPLSSPSSPTFNPSQHQGLFKWISSSHQEAKVLEFQLQHQSFLMCVYVYVCACMPGHKYVYFFSKKSWVSLARTPLPLTSKSLAYL